MKAESLLLRFVSGPIVLALAVTLYVVLAMPSPANSQAVEINADHLGGILHPVAGRPSFEVAVVRQSAPGAEFRFNGIGMHPGDLTVTGTTVKDLIAFAYAVPDEKEVTGGPNWIGKERFDLHAKVEEADLPTLKSLPLRKLKDEMRVRLQVLLEQRFKLQVSFRKKELPLLVLEVAKGGSKCKRVVANDVAAFDNLPPPPPPEDSHRLSAPGGETEMNSIHWRSGGLPFPLILSWISEQPEVNARTVVDQTGLSGGFECEITWTREEADPTNSSFFTALREQLGLRLRSERGAVEIVDIEKIEPPSAN